MAYLSSLFEDEDDREIVVKKPFNPFTSALSETLTDLTSLHRAPSKTLTVNNIIRFSPSILHVVKGIDCDVVAGIELDPVIRIATWQRLQQFSMVNVAGRNSNLQNIQNMSGVHQNIIGNTIGPGYFVNRRLQIE
ncbi:hypothetical protein Hanom_Chr17g01564161 [Helianthus anomalus]